MGLVKLQQEILRSISVVYLSLTSGQIRSEMSVTQVRQTAILEAEIISHSYPISFLTRWQRAPALETFHRDLCGP
jgi:hypothetical protein